MDANALAATEQTSLIAAQAASQAAVLTLIGIVVQSLAAVVVTLIGLKTARTVNQARQESREGRGVLVEKVTEVKKAQEDTDGKIDSLEKNTNSLIKDSLAATAKASHAEGVVEGKASVIDVVKVVAATKKEGPQ